MSWSLIFLISEWIIRLVMVVVVPHRSKPVSAMAWLVIIMFEPWVGLILYLTIGENRLPMRRIDRHARLIEYFQNLSNRFAKNPAFIPPEIDAVSLPMMNLATTLGQMPILGGNDVVLMSDTNKVIEKLIADIDGAKEHVHLLFYILADDCTGKSVITALQRAVERGVKCRLMVDSVGSRPLIKRQSKKLAEAGIEFRVALPVNVLRRRLKRIDLRNHRKLAVIDGRIGYAGSQNIIDADYGRKNLIWQDMMARLTGPVVTQLQTIFLRDWYFESNQILEGEDIFPEPELRGEVPVQVLPSGPSFPTDNYQRLVVEALYSANERVVITTPYFIPDEPFLQALQVAVLRGAEVIIIVPERYDQIFAGAASKSYYSQLLRAGVKVYLYREGLLHTKSISIDSRVSFIGSSNFDIRSFELNFEINLVFYHSPVTEAIEGIQNEYISKSRLLDYETWNRRSFWVKVFQNIVKLFSPLL